MGLVFLIIPILGYIYWLEAKSFIVEGQKHSQAMMAQSLATLAASQKRLFFNNPASVELIAIPTSRSKDIDGNRTDWLNHAYSQTFALQNQTSFSNQTSAALSFQLSLSDASDNLYLMLEYKSMLGASTIFLDHIRLELLDSMQAIQRFIIKPLKNGRTQVIRANRDWEPLEYQVVNLDIFAIQGTYSNTLNTEIRISNSLLSTDKKISVSAVFKDSELGHSYVISTNDGLQGRLNTVSLRDVQVEQLFSSIDRDFGKVWILNTEDEILASAGRLALDESITIPSPIIRAMGKESVMYQSVRSEVVFNAILNMESIVTTAPIYDSHKNILGVIAIEQGLESVITEQKDQVMFLLGTLFGIVVTIYLILYLFSRSLVSRIQHFQTELMLNIDAEGRIQNTGLSTQRQRDELGELNRTTAQLLQKLYGYSRYLERLPSVLRHEMHNPLHVINSSLFNLQETHTELNGSKYLQSAYRGVERLEQMVESFTQASSIDDALTQEDMEHFDLVALLKGYCQYRPLEEKNIKVIFETQLPEFKFKGNDFRIEQMLDKLVGNAVSFAHPDTDVIVSLLKNKESLILSVSNSGPLIDATIAERVFEPMFSQRPQKGQSMHLGLGLYVAKKITTAHEGEIHIRNKADLSGVEVLVKFSAEPN